MRWSDEMQDAAREAALLDPSDLVEEAAKISHDLRTWTESLAEANAKLGAATLAKEVKMARMRLAVLRKGGEEGAKRQPHAFAEWKVDARVLASESYEELRRAEIEAELERDKILGIVRAIFRKGRSIDVLLGGKMARSLEDDPYAMADKIRSRFRNKKGG